MTLPSQVETYLSLVDRAPPDAPEQTRFVSLDCETTGLDPKTSRLVAIGCVAVRDGQILLDDAFETLVRTPFNTASVTVHGITREESREGLREDDALLDLLDYLRDAVVVGHHIEYDLQVIDQALDRNWGVRLHNRRLDTMGLALLLERDGAFEEQPPFESFSLDALCERFGVKPYDRHTASGDAFLTAQVFLRLLKTASRCGRDTLVGLLEEWKERA